MVFVGVTEMVGVLVGVSVGVNVVVGVGVNVVVVVIVGVGVGVGATQSIESRISPSTDVPPDDIKTER